MDKPIYQKIVTSYLPWVLLGITFISSLIDTIKNLELISPSTTYFGTIVILILLIGLEIKFRKKPIFWIAESGEKIRIKSLGIKNFIVGFGLIAALWIPRTLPATSDSSTSSPVMPTTNTEIPTPIQTPDVANLYTYFPPPTANSTRTYNFSVIYSDFSGTATEPKIETGSYSEVVRIVNDKFRSNGITIIGVERIGGDYVVPCSDKFYWYVYDASRFYTICSKNYVDAAGSQIAVDKEPNLVINSQFEPEPLTIMPHYLAPLEIDKQWQADYYITVQDKVTKRISLGTFYDCFKLRFFMIHYEEFRYVCPTVGVVAIEISSRGDFYSAELASFK